MSDTLQVENIVKEWQFSKHARKQKSSIIRAILKDSTKPGVVNFAGGLPAPIFSRLRKSERSVTR